MLREFDVVSLKSPKPECGLPAGWEGTVVLLHDGGAAADVEFDPVAGKPVVATVEEREVTAVRQKERVD